MNSFIFNSKTFHIFLILAASFLTCYFFLGKALDFIVLSRTNKSVFTESIESKAKHMAINHQTGDLDLIFTGSSRTEYQISQKIFKEYGLNTYNLGVAGTRLINFPSVIEKAVCLRPETVVMNISIQTLYDKNWDMPITVTLKDIKILLKSGAGFRTVGRAIMKFFAGTNRLRLYADPVNSQLRSLYSRFEPAKTNSKNRDNDKIIAHQKKVRNAVEHQDMLNIPGCKVMQKNRISDKKTSVKCSCGDGILFGSDTDTSKLKEIVVLEKINMSKINFINILNNTLNKYGIDLLLIFEPNFYTKYIYDIDNLKGLIDAQIIDNSFILISQEPLLWGDNGHLNYKGRDSYSILLAERIFDKLKKKDSNSSGSKNIDKNSL